MPNEGLLTILKTLCDFNNVDITHTFSSNSKDVVTVRCFKKTKTIEITNLTNNKVTLYDNLEESAEAIQLLMKEIDC